MPEEKPVENLPAPKALPVAHSTSVPPVARPWKPRIPEILNDLRSFEGVYLTRSDIEARLEVKRSQADAVMRQVGILKATDVGIAGKANVVLRTEFLVWLEVHYDDSARKEHDRLERLQQRLEDAKDEQKCKAKWPHFKKEAKEQVKAVLLGDLDQVPGCRLEPPTDGKPGRFEILFTSAMDFIAKYQLFGWTLIHQEEKFHQMMTPISTPKQEELFSGSRINAEPSPAGSVGPVPGASGSGKA